MNEEYATNQTKLLACVDTYYHEQGSRTALVLFDDWADGSARQEIVAELHDPPAEYVPGEFFRREMPSIMNILEGHIDRIGALIIDGYVWLDDQGRKGIGAILHDEVGGRFPIIGVAKRQFAKATGRRVYRESSQNPLIVTAIGIHEITAADKIKSMHGPYRIPTLLKWADTLSRRESNARRPEA